MSRLRCIEFWYRNWAKDETKSLTKISIGSFIKFVYVKSTERNRGGTEYLIQLNLI